MDSPGSRLHVSRESKVERCDGARTPPVTALVSPPACPPTPLPRLTPPRQRVLFLPLLPRGWPASPDAGRKPICGPLPVPTEQTGLRLLPPSHRMIPLPTTTRPELPAGPVPVDLRRLFPGASFVGCGDLRVHHASERSDQCRSQSLFAVIRGRQGDGSRHIPDALSRGAGSLLVDRPCAGVHVPQCVVPDVRRAHAELQAALHGQPARRLALAGVTGTNGKTTTTWLVRSILRSAGHQAGILGTIEYHDGVNSLPASLTTPDAATLSGWLAAMVRHRTTCAALEVSSHALDQHRLAGTGLDAAVITNITRDHFDYHGDFEHYRGAKARILDCLKPLGVAIINLDDPGARSLLPTAPRRTLSYSLCEPADLRAEILEETPRGSRFRLTTREWQREAHTPLVGRYNVSNCLAACAVGHAFGLDPDLMVRGLARLTCVPGRVERLDLGQPFPVLVDYAHTPDALERCLTAVRPLAPGRVLCVFGAGGDRDREKRPLMGRVAARLADLTILTSDNPRSEEPGQILDQVEAGMAGVGRPPYREPDRRVAIRWALQHAGPGDLVVIAGKGHETEQVIGNDRRHFDDREVARECLRELLASAAPPPPSTSLACP